MSLDVAIVTFESAAHLRRCLAGLPGEARAIVVDNASTDGSADLGAELGAEVIRNPDNRGFAAAANQGARVGEGEAILFLNPDAVIDADNLALLTAALHEAPRVAAVAPRLVHPDGRDQRAWWPLPSPRETWREALGLHRLRPATVDADGTVPFVVGACLLVRRSAFEQLGGFDERFWLYGEDADLCRRAWEAGWQVRLVPGARAGHVGGASAEGAPGAAFEHFQRGAEHFIGKHHGRWSLLLHRLGLLVGSVLRLVVLAGRPGAGGRPAWRTRKAMVARLARVLVRHPLRIAADPPDGSLPTPRLRAVGDTGRRRTVLAPSPGDGRALPVAVHASRSESTLPEVAPT